VNWVWATGVLAFHVIYSIGLPILLLGLAVPRTRGRSLIGRRGIVVALLSLTGSTAFETVIVYGSYRFWMGTPLLVGSLVVIALLVVLAYRVPSGALAATRDRPTLSPRAAGAIGFLVFPVLFLLEYYVPYFGAPPAAIIGGELVFLVLLLEDLRRGMGRVANEYLLVNLAFGFVLWQSVFGILLTIGLPYTIPLVVLAVWFFLRLRRAYAPTPNLPLPPGVLGT